MKKINVNKLWTLVKPVSLAMLMTAVGVSLAWGADNPIATYYSGNTTHSICGLLDQFKTVFRILRILCFGGAAFIIMGWAWTFMTSGEAKLNEDGKKKGVAMLVAFLLLFGVGVLLTYLPSLAAGVCTNVITLDW